MADTKKEKNPNKEEQKDTEKEPQKVAKKAKKEAFIYIRGIKCLGQGKAQKNISIVQNKDFSIGPYNEVKIIETDKEDYQAKVLSQVESCSLPHIIKMAQSQGKDPRTCFALKPEDLRDCSEDPESLEELRDRLAASQGARSKIKEIAKKLGVDVKDLIKAHIDGNLGQFIVDHTIVEPEAE